MCIRLLVLWLGVIIMCCEVLNVGFCMWGMLWLLGRVLVGMYSLWWMNVGRVWLIG